ncbi:MAG: hypothetical protein HYZ92_04990 [Candidatus Omnitrophica bacterium]|nr:hypothetical protein [Candidatus Omnitrophota bacterium]
MRGWCDEDDSAAVEQQGACPICRAANDQSAAYAQKASSTLVRGATNTAFGWTELLTEPTEEVSSGGNLLIGVGKGLNQAVRRTALGIGELLTFWTPKGPRGYLTLNRDCPICMGRLHQQQQQKAQSQSAPSRR